MCLPDAHTCNIDACANTLRGRYGDGETAIGGRGSGCSQESGTGVGALCIPVGNGALAGCLDAQSRPSRSGSTEIRRGRVRFSLFITYIEPSGTLHVPVNDAKRIILRFHPPVFV